MSHATATLETFFALGPVDPHTPPVRPWCLNPDRGHEWRLTLDPHPDEAGRWVFDGFRCMNCGTGLFPWEVDGWPFGRLNIEATQTEAVS